MDADTIKSAFDSVLPAGNVVAHPQKVDLPFKTREEAMAIVKLAHPGLPEEWYTVVDRVLMHTKRIRENLMANSSSVLTEKEKKRAMGHPPETRASK